MRLINADELEERMISYYELERNGDWELREEIKDFFDNAPTIDAVPVVRCKNCKWWGLSEYNAVGIHVCKKFGGVRVKTDFCSRAERSEE